MAIFRTLGRILTAPFRRSDAGMVLGSDPPPPVRRPLPFAPQSDPRLMAWAKSVVEKVRTAAAAGHLRFLPHLDFYTGETPEIREQYRQMLREPTLKAAVGTKVLSVAQLDPQAHPEDPDDPRQREAGDFVLYALRKLRGGPRALAWSVLVHGLLDGWSVCEKVWHREPVPSGRFTGKRIYRTVKAKDSRTLTPVVDEFKNVEGIRAGLYNAGRVFSPDDFVTWSHMPLFESPVGMSDFRAPYRAYWIKNTTWQLRGLHLEKWTGPFLKGEYGHVDQKATLEAALEEAQAKRWITVPTGTLIDAIEISTRGTADFEAALRDCDREMLIGTVGASLQILEGQVTDARGDTGEHRATSELFQWMLAAALGDVVTECMAPELVEVNYAGVEPPAITWGSVSERDMQARLATDKGLQEIGLRLSKKEAYRHYSRAEPADEADVLRPGGKDNAGDAGPGNGAPGPGGPASPFDGPPDARAYAETPPRDAPPLDTLDWALQGYQPERDPETGDWLQGDQPPDDAEDDAGAGDEADHAAYAEGYTGERKDALGRRRCYQDGRPVPCAPREGEPGPAERRKQQRQEQEAARRAQPPKVTAQDARTATAKLRDLLGADMALERAAALVGAPRGSAVEVYPSGMAGATSVSFFVSHPDVEQCWRSLDRDDAGKLVMKNQMFFLKKKARGGGLGTEVFSAEVKALAEQGVDRIETCAGKGQGMNGFSTWPRLGYDAPIPPEVARKLPPSLAGAKTVLELYQTKEGREWWGGVPQPDGKRKGAHGVMMSLSFDLSPGSRSLSVLNAYLASKGKPPIEIDAGKVQALREGRDPAKKERQRTEQEQRERAHAEVMEVRHNAAQWASRAGLDLDKVEEDATNEVVAIAHERGENGTGADPDPATLWRTAYRRVVERHVLAR